MLGIALQTFLLMSMYITCVVCSTDIFFHLTGVSVELVLLSLLKF